MKLRCCVFKGNFVTYTAICLDLNLFACGDTVEEVKNKLYDMMIDYVKEAYTVDKEFVHDLIPRTAPYIYYLKYYLNPKHRFSIELYDILKWSGL